MKVTKIHTIKGYRLFRDFTWQPSLDDFGQFNLIYGWNRAGKTTLSLLFRHLQDHSPIQEGQVEFEIAGNRISGSVLSNAQLPNVRVFNRDFVAATILAAGGQMDPIYYFGEDSVEKQKQVEQLNAELDTAQRELTSAQNRKSLAEKALDDFCITKAKYIKELLISSHTPQYNNYDKRDFKRVAGGLSKDSAAAALLVDEVKEALKKQKEATQKDIVSSVVVDVSEFTTLASEVEILLQRSVVSEAIEELARDTEVSAWVQKGMALHSGDRKSDKCRFCDQHLPAARIDKLEAHFNNAFTSFQSEVTTLAKKIKSQYDNLAGMSFPDSARMYEHLEPDLKAAALQVQQIRQVALAFLDALHKILLRKHEAPFERLSLGSALLDMPKPDHNSLLDAIQLVNEVIEKHNVTTKDFTNKVKSASETLELCYVAEAFQEFCQLSDMVISEESGIQSVISTPPALKDRIAAIEREIVEHRRPAEELNVELRSYLGHDELCLDVKDTGYVMKRGGQTASNLSESEKTAIAFLYFLKCLQDRSFNLSNSIVVIDDPVSSLDANSLFSAFGYMKEQTKGAGQLFVLTHNFGFFRQVKNWFHHLPNQRKRRDLRPARFYLLKTRTKEGQRTTSIARLDPLLEQYESEYHYLFKQVYTEVHRDEAEATLEEYYGMPNMARRLLEAFLAFRHPANQGDLYKQLEQVDFDACKKSSILRFLNTYSHSGTIADCEHDASVLSETRTVLNLVLEMIEKCDAMHYRAMVEIIEKTEADNDE